MVEGFLCMYELGAPSQHHRGMVSGLWRHFRSRATFTSILKVSCLFLFVPNPDHYPALPQTPLVTYWDEVESVHHASVTLASTVSHQSAVGSGGGGLAVLPAGNSAVCLMPVGLEAP